jgi:Uma2 family endonuclease
MSTADLPPRLLEVVYAEYAREYCRSLPLEHFMEATAQGRQREITLESLALVHARRPEVQVFNELLIQYPRRGQKRPGQVVPDNMVVLHDEPIRAEGSYDTPLQPVGPTWVLEYVSKTNKRKDYEDSFSKYERDLKVPYCLMFYPDGQELTLFHRGPRKYRTVRPNEHRRLAVTDLEVEVALLDGWVRFWYKGELLPLPGDLQCELDEARHREAQERRRAEQAVRETADARRRAEEATREAAELRDRLAREEQARRALEEELNRLRARESQDDAGRDPRG